MVVGIGHPFPQLKQAVGGAWEEEKQNSSQWND